jgi:hypothetical protein
LIAVNRRRAKLPAIKGALFMRIFLAVLALLGIAAPAHAMDLNSYRAKNGRAPLRVDLSLAGLASGHAADLARRGALDHAGFRQQRAPLGANAENVSYGCGDEACAILQWARSAGHRANMLRSDVTSYGLASAVSASGRRYWVMELGGAAPVVRTIRGRGRAYMEQATSPRRNASRE